TGWTESEFKMSGIAFPPIAVRLRMLDEALTIMRSLWTREETTFDGEFYQLRDATLWPKPLQQPAPPIIVGGGGNGLLRIAAKHADCLNLIPDSGKKGHISLENVRKMNDIAYLERIQFLRNEMKANDRDPGAIRISNFLFMVNITESRKA